MLCLSRSLRGSATQDTDKPEIQPVSEPESLISCVLSCVRVGQAWSRLQWCYQLSCAVSETSDCLFCSCLCVKKLIKSTTSETYCVRHFFFFLFFLESHL